MRKECVYAFIILIILVNFASAEDEACTPDWHCTPWSDCISGDQIRSCVDFSLCGVETGKPDETQDCFLCAPNWDCGDWAPPECPEGELQTKNCTDLNDCGTVTDKPVDSRHCAYDPQFSLGFVLLVSLIFFFIAIDILLIIRQWEKINPPGSSVLKYEKRGPPGKSAQKKTPPKTKPLVPDIKPKQQAPPPQPPPKLNVPAQQSPSGRQSFTPHL